MEGNSLVEQINKDLSLQLRSSFTEEDLIAALAEYMNHLIQNNFSELVRLLYRIDVSEKALKHLLQTHPNADAGRIIAALIIERQKQKIASRSAHKSDYLNIPPDERW